MATTKPIIAAKHLDPCEIKDCKFSHSTGAEDEPSVCCFGLRHEGCIYFNRGMQRNVQLLASVEEQLTVAKYEADPWWAARTRNDQIDYPSNEYHFPGVDNIVEPVLENIGKITKKVYNFVYEGHEYTYRDGSIDHGISCPHCGHENLKDRDLIGYYGNGHGRIVCSMCLKCWKEFYYHDPK